MAAASATGVIAVRLSGNTRSTMGAAVSRAGRAAPTRVARRASRRVVAAAGADRFIAGKAHPKRVANPTCAMPVGFASAGLARVGSSRGASFAARSTSGARGELPDDDAPVHLTAEEREALDAEAAAMASSWANELSAAAWDDAEASENSGSSGSTTLGPEKTHGKKKTHDKSLRAAVANEAHDDESDAGIDDDRGELLRLRRKRRRGRVRAALVGDDGRRGVFEGWRFAHQGEASPKDAQEWGTLSDEQLPRVAIVGRPSVGKSALFNRLTGTKRAIVYDQPGITRDRMYVRAFWGDVEFMMVDTGGLESLPGSPQDAPSVNTVGGVEILPGMVESQAALAVREAAALVFVVDGQKGLTSADEEIFGWIRKFHSATPLMLAVNKCESTTKGEEQILDF